MSVALSWPPAGAASGQDPPTVSVIDEHLWSPSVDRTVVPIFGIGGDQKSEGRPTGGRMAARAIDFMKIVLILILLIGNG
ncbi:hypothetical protein [Micromonospora avicenniae]|uniref:hypothetical protein n=1 Tax=Micromonospora avicenniae TaxID=1198245 RepID=UPI00332733ED